LRECPVYRKLTLPMVLVCEAMSAQRRKVYGNESGCKPQVTKNIGNLGKLREAIMLRRSIRMEIPHIKGRNFYPLLRILGNTAISALKHERPFPCLSQPFINM